MCAEIQTLKKVQLDAGTLLWYAEIEIFRHSSRLDKLLGIVSNVRGRALDELREENDVVVYIAARCLKRGGFFLLT